ncbi:MAG TPA: alanine--glyoxylate aminotransferase family protein [Candidatus Acidoferrales bacterium]|nr:alanine--glyoxylate aminotransferase family protein [Candidatus Acidoferrales bacterium]
MPEMFGELLAPDRLMLTPGPSMLDPRVYRAMAAPIVGHMDPWFLQMMGEVQTLLRQAFQTENRITFPISASGSGGIETAVMNTLDEGDECIVCVNGAFSERMAIVAERARAKVIRVTCPEGATVDPEDVRRAGKGKKIKFVGLTHGETSTGVLQRSADYRRVADELGALLIVDAVASMGGVPLDVAAERIDICFSGSQKAISAPPGMAPITVNERVEALLRARKSPPGTWYFDLNPIMNYWGHDRTYHHTPPISLIYGMREALRLVMEEGLEARWERHAQNQQALIAGLEAMGIEMLVRNPADRLVTVTAAKIPAAVDDRKLRAQLLEEFTIQIAGGIGANRGKIWRIGLMGYSSQRKHVLLLLAALEKLLPEQGFRMAPGAGIAAAIRAFQEAAQPAGSAAR